MIAWIDNPEEYFIGNCAFPLAMMVSISGNALSLYFHCSVEFIKVKGKR
jgi:hypothetical protein